jgi:hypothetical protein
MVLISLIMAIMAIINVQTFHSLQLKRAKKKEKRLTMLSYFVYAHLQLAGLEGKTLHKITTGKMCQIMLPAQSARLTSVTGSA